MDPNNDRHELMVRKPTLLTRIKAHWHPQPLKAPQVDPDLPHLNALQRAVEALRDGFLALEHWMSPNGRIREFIRFNAILAVVLLVPALVIMPIITLILGQVAGWVAALANIACSLVIIPLAVLATIILVKLVIVVTRAHFGR